MRKLNAPSERSERGWAMFFLAAAALIGLYGLGVDRLLSQIFSMTAAGISSLVAFCMFFTLAQREKNYAYLFGSILAAFFVALSTGTVIALVMIMAR